MDLNFLSSIDVKLIWEYRYLLLDGMRFNLLVLVLSACLSVILSTLICAMRFSTIRNVRYIGGFVAEVARNTPEYIMLVWIHFVPLVLLTQIFGIKAAPIPLVSAVVALGICSSGYISETFRAGILSVPRGHREAAKALGMTPLMATWRIVIPQALRRMSPELFNLTISLFKGTTLVSLIAVPDVMYQVSQISAQEMKPIPLYTGAALLFCCIVIMVSIPLRRLGNRWQRQVS